MGLSPKQIDLLMKWIKLHEVKRIPRDTLFDDARWLNKGKDLVDVARYIQPIQIIDPVTREAPQIISGDRLKVESIDEIQTAVELGGAGVPVVLTTTSRWKIVGIIMEAAMSGDVADRVLSLISTPVGLLTATVDNISITGPTLSADQTGGIHLPEGPATWLNDNDAVTIQADTNPLPMTVESGTVIVGDSDNTQATDLFALRVYYIEV